MSGLTVNEHSSISFKLKNLGITRERLYELSGELQISKTSFYPLACARLSGRIAEVLIWKSHESRCGYIVKIYSGTGQIISGYYWRTSLNLLSFNWIRNDTLLFIFENGFVFSYGSGKHHVPTKVLHLANLPIRDITFYSKGFVASTGSGSFLKVFCEDKTVKFVKVTLDTRENVQCLAIKEWVTNAEHEDLYIATESGVSYYRHATCKAQIQRKLVQSLCLSHIQSFLAVYHRNGILSVFEDNLGKILYQVNLKVNDPPIQIAWVASSALALAWQEKVILVGKENNVVEMHGDIYIFQECDGVRVISNNYHDYLRPLQGSCNLHFYAEMNSTTEVFTCDLFRALAEISEPFLSKRVEHLVSINDHFAMAQFVFDRNQQKRYMKEAILESTLLCQTDFLYVKKAVVKCCSLLRKLNYFRHASIGMPLTAIQYKLICKKLLLKRLLIFGHRALALRIFENNSLKRSQILLDWISLPTDRKGQSEKLFHLSNKFPDIFLCNSIDQAKITNHKKYQVVRNGPRTRLKADLSDELIGETMSKAICCKDIDAQYLTIFTYLSNKSRSGLEYALQQNTFFNILYYRYNVHSVLVPSIKQKFRDKVNKTEFYEYFGTVFKAHISQSATNERVADKSFLNSLKDQSYRILQNYMELFEDGITSTRTVSLRKFMFLLLLSGRVNLVAKICDKHKFSERHYTFLKVKSLCKTKSWESLSDVNAKTINSNSLIALLKKYGAPENIISFYKAQTKSENTSKLLEGTLLEAQKAAFVLSESRQNLTTKATEYMRALNYYT